MNSLFLHINMKVVNSPRQSYNKVIASVEKLYKRKNRHVKSLQKLAPMAEFASKDQLFPDISRLKSHRR